jgi:peptidoglycan-associated lipoprotein
MFIRTGNTIIPGLLTVALTLATGTARAQQMTPPAPRGQAELGLDYSLLRNNAPPNGCGCFSMNGGSATAAFPLPLRGLFAVADVTAAHAGGISPKAYSLMLEAFTVGGRYRLRKGNPLLQPYGQVLVGAGHASGSITQGANPAAANAGLFFATNTGGGVDLRIGRRLSLRLLEADYLLTTLQNGSDNRQNVLRLSSGVVIRFGR